MTAGAPGSGDALERCASLADGEVASVLGLCSRLTDRVGAWPLNEDATGRLVGSGAASGTVHTMVHRAGDLVGYAQWAPASASPQGWAEVVAEDAEVAAMLLDSLPRGTLAWCHGSGSPVPAAAARLGWPLARRLWLMARTLADAVHAIALPADLHLRTFRVGADESAWLDLNARAFTDLPDQGGWERADLARRMASSWFDPAGILVVGDAEGHLVGSIWTKIHPGPVGAPGTHAGESVGEIYVMMVDPEQRGRGVGAGLLAAGLDHVRRAGLRTVVLYVDAVNATAIGLYRRAGFEVIGSDTAFREYGARGK